MNLHDPTEDIAGIETSKNHELLCVPKRPVWKRESTYDRKRSAPNEARPSVAAGHFSFSVSRFSTAYRLLLFACTPRAMIRTSQGRNGRWRSRSNRQSVGSARTPQRPEGGRCTRRTPATRRVIACRDDATSGKPRRTFSFRIWSHPPLSSPL